MQRKQQESGSQASRSLNAAALGGCFCAQGSSGATEGDLDSDTIVVRFNQQVQSLRSDELFPGVDETTEIAPSGVVLDQSSACEDLLEPLGQTADRTDYYLDPGVRNVLQGEEDFFCRACLGDVDNFVDTCCQSQVSFQDHKLSVSNVDIFCSTCSTSSLPFISKVYQQFCCSDPSTANPDLCCSTPLKPRKVPDYCECPSSNRKACTYCSKLLKTDKKSGQTKIRNSKKTKYCKHCQDDPHYKHLCH